MKHLLDVNVLVAWGWRDHVAHERTVRWIAGQKHARGAKRFTSPIPEICSVRVSVPSASGRISVQQAADVLRGRHPHHRCLHPAALDAGIPGAKLLG